MSATKYFTDRSRILQHQRCPRSRYEGYHRAGLGIMGTSKPLPLAVGGAVHAGIEVLLRDGQAYVWEVEGRLVLRTGEPPATYMEAITLMFQGGGSVTTAQCIEERAVAAALADFAQYTALEIDTTELAAMGAPKSDEGESIAKTLGLPEDDPAVVALRAEVGQNFNKFESYLRAEQTAMVEAMVRAYARRRLRPLLEQFEVLEVEREGQWQLAEWKPGWPLAPAKENDHEINFMSRPDALLRERESNQLLILSLKTTASWDVRKARDAEHDMQGLSEGVEVEQRLGTWWGVVQSGATRDPLKPWWNDLSVPMEKFLRGLSSAPRIYAIRYEYMLKGQRRVDKELSAQLGMECRSQGSHLVRGLLNSGMAKGDEQWCWSWDFKKEDGSSSKLYYKTWKGQPVWEHMTIREWIDGLEEAALTMSAEDATVGLEPRALGYSCKFQTGFTEEHPLDSVFLSPVTVYRNDDDLRDWIDATEASERRVVEGLVQIAAMQDSSEIRHLMNVYFPMHRQACEYPSTCSFVKICYGSEEMRQNPVASGVYVAREVNHPQEVAVD